MPPATIQTTSDTLHSFSKIRMFTINLSTNTDRFIHFIGAIKKVIFELPTLMWDTLNQCPQTHLFPAPFPLKFRVRSSCFLMVKALLQFLHARWQKHLLLQIPLLHSSYTIQNVVKKTCLKCSQCSLPIVFKGALVFTCQSTEYCKKNSSEMCLLILGNVMRNEGKLHDY